MPPPGSRWNARGLPDQLGIPMIDATAVQLLEATRKLRPAATAAMKVWDRAHTHGAYMWMPEFGLECARIGLRAGDEALLHRLVDDLDSQPYPQSDWAASDVDLINAIAATALSGADPMTVVAAARSTAEAHDAVGFQVGRVRALEEAACAPRRGRRQGPRPRHRPRDTGSDPGMGAVTISERLCSRLRPHGLRLTPSATRERPQTGWDALTRTERAIAELVGDGCNGPEIAERLHISTRTVQTHVSHALTKLGLRARRTGRFRRRTIAIRAPLALEYPSCDGFRASVGWHSCVSRRTAGGYPGVPRRDDHLTFQ